MKSNIYVIGSSNTDMVIKSNSIPKPGETVIGGDFYNFQGGKGANQAVAAAKLGGKVTLICKVGNDSFGNKSIENYQAYNINTKHILKDKKENTGIALIMVDKNGENSISVASGANSKLMIKDVDFLEKELEKNDIVLVQLEIPLVVVEYLITLCNRKNIKLILNPAPFKKIKDEFLKYVHTITPNMIEAKSLTKIDVIDTESSKLAAQKLLNKGVKNVLITMGSNGVLFMSKKQMAHLKAKKVKVIDTTAAGDTFNGALASAFSFGMDIIESIEFSNSAAAFSVSKLGAQDSIPSIDQLENKYRSYVHS